jgi:ATP-binding cassette subfamily B (MDR/TAP) protein 1
MPIAFIAIPFLSARVQPNIEAQASALNEAAKITTSALTSIETVKCYNGEDGHLRSYAKTIERSASFYSRQALWISIQAAIIRLASLGMFVLGFWFSNYLLDHGFQSPSTLITTISAAIVSTSAFMQIIPQLIHLEKGRTAGHKLCVAMARVEDEEHTHLESQKKIPGQCVGDISFEKVLFR